MTDPRPKCAATARRQRTARLTIPDPDDAEVIGYRPRDAARVLGVSVKQLERWRADGIGPGYVQDHAGCMVIYPREALVRWMRQRTTTPKGRKP